MIIPFCGIPGSGKTTVLREFQALSPSTLVLNYGTLMLEAADLSEADRDRLRKGRPDELLKLGMKAAQIAATRAQGTTILDIHAFVRSPDTFVPGLPKRILDILPICACVCLECEPEVIAVRRERDGSRQRDRESLEEIRRHQELNRAFLVSCSMQYGVPLSLIDNTYHARDAAQHLMRTVRHHASP